MKISLEKYHNEKVARIVGEILSDGHIQLDNRYLISFYAKDKSVMDNFISRFQKIFGIKEYLYKDRGRYKVYFKSKKIASVLINLGVPFGNKTNSPFLVPKWIFNGCKQVKSNFLSAIYDCEGYIYSTKTKYGKRWRIGLEFYKNKEIVDFGIEFMNQLKKILNEFNINSSPVRFKKGNIRKDGSESIGVRFEIEKSSFENFYKYINFQIKSKRGKLIKAIWP